MDRVELVINYLNEHVDKPLNIEVIAKVACISPVQLYRLFKAATGLTPIQYHEHLRINESLKLLQKVDRVRDVAYDLGYENYETYSRAFKKICSFSPSDLQWGMSYLDKLHPEGNYALVKEEATLVQIKAFIQASEESFASPTELFIYRFRPRTKGRPIIKRCLKAEKWLKLQAF